MCDIYHAFTYLTCLGVSPQLEHPPRRWFLSVIPTIAFPVPLCDKHTICLFLIDASINDQLAGDRQPKSTRWLRYGTRHARYGTWGRACRAWVWMATPVGPVCFFLMFFCGLTPASCLSGPSMPLGLSGHSFPVRGRDSSSSSIL